MVHGSIFFKAYDRTKQRVWRIFGSKLYKERTVFLANFLSQLDKELNFSGRISSSENYLLDIGCGTGELTQKTSEIFHINAIGVGLDRWFGTQSESCFLIADGCMLPFRPKTFVLTSAYSLVEHVHIKCRQLFYEEVSRVLEDNGLFIIQLPNRYFPIEQHSFLPFVGYLPARLHSLFFYSYVSVPSKEEVVKELTRSGFIIILIATYGIPFLNLFQRKLLSKMFPFGFIIVARRK